jgi:hypothetical protein
MKRVAYILDGFGFKLQASSFKLVAVASQLVACSLQLEATASIALPFQLTAKRS